MKVLFLENQNKELQTILTKLGVEVKIIAKDKKVLIKEWQKDESVKVFNTHEFRQLTSVPVDFICKGLEVFASPYNFIADNFTQNQMNNLTFSEVEYVKSLKSTDMANGMYPPPSQDMCDSLYNRMVKRSQKPTC